MATLSPSSARPTVPEAAPRTGIGRRWWTAVVLGALSIGVVWFNLRYLTSVNPVDFLVYRYGSALAFDGGDLYAANLFGPMMPTGGLPFTYTPFGAVALWPTTLLGWRAAYWVWSVGCLLILAWVVYRVLPTRARLRPVVTGAAFLMVAATSVVAQHIHYGQINLVLMGLVAADLFRSENSRLGRFLPRGVLVGLAAAIKLTPGLFIVFFLVTRQWKAALWSSVGAAGATLVGLVVFPAATVDFFTTVLFSLTDRVDLDGGVSTYGNNSITGALAALGSWATPATLPLLVVAGAAALWLARRTFLAGDTVGAWVVIGLAAPLLSPVSWIHHWVWILPALILLLVRVPTWRTWATVALVVVSISIGPGAGQSLLDNDSPWLIVPGVLQRQCLMLASVLCMILIARSGREQSSRRQSSQQLSGRQENDRQQRGLANGEQQQRGLRSQGDRQQGDPGVGPRPDGPTVGVVNPR